MKPPPTHDQIAALLVDLFRCDVPRCQNDGYATFRGRFLCRLHYTQAQKAYHATNDAKKERHPA